MAHSPHADRSGTGASEQATPRPVVRFTDPRWTYRVFGATYAVVVAVTSLLVGLEVGQPFVGATAAVVLGGLGLAVFRKFADEHEERDLPPGAGELRATSGVATERVRRVLRLSPAFVWVLGVLLLEVSGIALGPIGTAAVAVVGCVGLWKGAVAIPRVAQWVEPEA